MPPDKLEEFKRELFYLLDKAHNCHCVKVVKWDIDSLISRYNLTFKLTIKPSP